LASGEHCRDGIHLSVAEYMEITLRARIRIGELVRELEKAQGVNPVLRASTGTKSKEDAIEVAQEEDV